jgi:hypothetical protein
MKSGGGSLSPGRAQSSVLGPQSFGSFALNTLLLLVILNLTLQPLTEPDFGWHLRTGLDLLHQGLALPTFDPYSHTMSDWAWVEHAWLTDVMIGGLYTLGGGLSVILFFGVVAAGAWIVASRAALCDMTARLLACALSLWAALPYLGARTQLISLLGLAILMNMFLRCRPPARGWWLPFLFLLWVNLHGGFTAGLFFLGLVLITALIVRWILTRRPQLAARLDEPIWSQRDFQQLALMTGLSALVTFVNPYGWNLYGEIADSLSDRFMVEMLQEWQPLSLSTVAGRSYALYVAGLVIALLCWYRRIEPTRWVVWTVFFALSLRHMRNIPIFLVVSLPLCAELLSVGSARIGRLFRLESPALRRWTLGVTCATGFFLFWLGPDHLQHVVQSGVQPAQYFKGTSYPIDAVEWIQSHRDRLGHRLYNDYVYGGFVLWWLPGEKVFIDGRMPAWRIGTRRIFQDYIGLTGGNPPDLSVLRKYEVDWALVRKQSPLDKALETEPTWSRVYQDDKVSIYVLGSA